MGRKIDLLINYIYIYIYIYYILHMGSQVLITDGSKKNNICGMVGMFIKISNLVIRFSVRFINVCC